MRRMTAMENQYDDILYHALNEQEPQLGFVTLKETIARASQEDAVTIMENLALVAPFYTDTGYAPMDAWMDQLANARNMDKERNACFAKWERDIAGLCVARTGRSDRGVVFTPDASEPGRVRYTEFDRMGFFSHSTFDSYKEAFDSAWDQGYREPTPGMIDALAITETWSKGMSATLEIQQYNKKTQKKSVELGRDELKSPKPK